MNKMYFGFLARSALTATILVFSCIYSRAEEGGQKALESGPVAVMPKLMEPDFEPRLGRYYYRFQWILRIGADAEVLLERRDGEYVITTNIQTGWFIDKIYHLRYRGIANLNATDLSPIKLETKEEVRSTRKQSRMMYRDGTIYSDLVKKKKDQEPRYQSYSQSVRGGRVMDPFSATLLARAMPWAAGDVRTIDVFDGRRMNQVIMECLGMEKMESLGKERDTWVVRLKIVQGDPENVDEDEELITDQVTVYMSADKSREVLRIEADTKFGHIKVFLEDFKPVSSP